jgi:hypothetical protein
LSSFSDPRHNKQINTQQALGIIPGWNMPGIFLDQEKYSHAILTWKTIGLWHTLLSGIMLVFFWKIKCFQTWKMLLGSLSG